MELHPTIGPCTPHGEMEEVHKAAEETTVRQGYDIRRRSLDPVDTMELWSDGAMVTSSKTITSGCSWMYSYMEQSAAAPH